MAIVIFKGTPAEGRALSQAIDRNCTCEFGLMGVRLLTCPAHRAFVEDQRFSDCLLFVRHMLAVREPGAGKRVLPLGS